MIIPYLVAILFAIAMFRASGAMDFLIEGLRPVLGLIGMPPEILDRIFRPFFSNKASGTGLGLALTRRIVQEHGGRLSVHSTVGSGSTFTIRLPLSDEGVDVGAAS